MNTEQAFLKYQAQTTPYPLMIKVSRATGSFIYNQRNEAFLDFVAGVSACNLGHCHPRIVEAVQNQAASYMHVMVYGEFIQNPSLKLCKLLAENLPKPLETTYLLNSGTEAMEGAMKLAKIFTSRTEIIAAKNAYHGNTQGSMSIMGFEQRKAPFRPLIPDVRFIKFNNFTDIEKITERTAAVVLETIQGGAGFILPEKDYLNQVYHKCRNTGALLILDEIQSGFGRTGKLFAFQDYDIIPDILVMGKAMAGGMPIGAFSTSYKIISRLKNRPKLGHITTFGGNPVISAAALASLKELLESSIMEQIAYKESLFRKALIHPLIKEIRGKGLMLSLILDTGKLATEVILKSLKKRLILFWLLFEPRAVRISPPLTISEKEILEGCHIILEVLEETAKNYKR